MSSRSRPLARVLVVVALVAVVAALWAWTPLRDVGSVADLQRLLAPVLQSPLLPVVLILTFLVAGLLFVSVWIVILQTCLLYPPAASVPLALCGALLSALVFYGVGRFLGRDVVERFAPLRVQNAVAGAGLETIIAVRVLPLLPYTFVNLSCGAFGVPLRTFFVGSVVGMAPGVVGVAVLGERVVAVLRDPTPQSLAAVVAVAVALAGVALVLRRRGLARARATARAQNPGRAPPTTDATGPTASRDGEPRQRT